MKSIFTYTQKNKIKKLAIGNFDGFHLGHLELFKHLNKFDSALLVIDKDLDNKLSPKDKMLELSILPLIFVDFDSIKDLEGEVFLNILKDEFKNLNTLIIGEDFKCGKNRAFGAVDIKKYINTIIIKEFKINQIGVHSSIIKDFLSKGLIQEANTFLGRFYAIKGQVIKGQGLGKKEIFATFNLKIKDYFIPKYGVWVSLCKIKDKYLKSLTFIGLRSTDNNFSIETHIIDDNFVDGDYLGYIFDLQFIYFLRENQKYDDLALLKEQITKDRLKALDILKDINER